MTPLLSQRYFSNASGERVVRLRGLPWQATEGDIKEFFQPLKFASDSKEGLPSILLALTVSGRPTGTTWSPRTPVVAFLCEHTCAKCLLSAFSSPLLGEAYARFETEEDFEKALAKDKERMGQRYIEVFSCAQSDMEKAHAITQSALKTPNTATMGSSPSSSSSSASVPKSEDDLRCVAVLRMRGLPFKATEADIMAFFEQSEVHVQEGGVHICKGHDGRVTGEAYVGFDSEEDARRGLQRHRDKMGSRYIEIFRSNKGELLNMLRRQQTARDLHREVMGHGSDSDRDSRHGWFSPHAHTCMSLHNCSSSPLLLVQLGRGGRGGHDHGAGEWVVRLRGLPFSATEEEIANWFAPMPARRAYIVYNHSGRPSGDAFAEFDNAEQWEHAMSKNREHMGSRYVEIFSSSKQELLHTLGPIEPTAPSRDFHHGPSSFERHPSSQVPHQYLAGGTAELGSAYGHPHYATPLGNYNPIASTLLAAGIGGPLSTPGVDPTVALLQLTSALSQQAAQIQARSHGAVAGQSQLDMMMRQAAAPGWPSPASAPSALTTPTMPYSAATSPASLTTPPYGSSAMATASVNQPNLPSSLYGNHVSSSSSTTPATTSTKVEGFKGVTLRIRGKGSPNTMHGRAIVNGFLYYLGVPYRATPREIVDFFAGYDIIPESVQVRAAVIAVTVISINQTIGSYPRCAYRWVEIKAVTVLVKHGFLSDKPRRAIERCGRRIGPTSDPDTWNSSSREERYRHATLLGSGAGTGRERLGWARGQSSFRVQWVGPLQIRVDSG